MELVFGVFAIAAAFVCVALFSQLKQARGQRLEATSQLDALQQKLDGLKKELGGAREEAAKKARLLEEARDEAKKRQRRDAKKAEQNASEEKKTDVNPREQEIASLRKALSALEQQLTLQKKEADRRVQDAVSAVQTDARSHDDKARERVVALEAEVKGLQRTLDELRASIKRKAEARPEVPGTQLDLQALSPEVVQELARLFRKGEEYERLYLVAQGQTQLAQDRILELQRRYFAVCREMAVAAGGSAQISDEDARKTAEALLAHSDSLSQRASAAGRADDGVGAGEEKTAADGEAAKKRRRRRRRRKPEGAAAAADDANDAGAHDDSDDDEDAADEATPDVDASDDAPQGVEEMPPPATSNASSAA